MKTLRRLLCLFLIPQLLFAPLAGAETLPYSLVDKSQYAIFEQEQAEARAEELAVDEPTDNPNLLQYSNDFWRQAVTAVEGDYSLDKEPEPIPDLTLLNPSLSLPLYGTNVALTGRYVLGFKLDAKRYKQDANNDIEDRNVSTFELQQELQLKMQGKILDRVFVDIDYDDKREEEKTLSVAYRGKPGEFVQLAEFGDINLSLPQTEFIAYQKQLFGAKMHLQHKDANLYLIGSQTKGSSKQKQFIGSSVFEIVSLKDTDYVRRTYYDLTFGNNIHPTLSPAAADDWRIQMRDIASGTDEVYLDSNTTNNDYVPIEKTATDYLGGAATARTAKWKLLQRGVDYTVDYASGVIQFRTAMTAASVVAVDYRNSQGVQLSSLGAAPGTIKIIKTENEQSISSSPDESANKLEIKTYYKIGAQKITRDNGKGNFILVLLDANGQEVGNQANPKQLYPSTIDVDFDAGTFQLGSRMTDDPGLYNTTPVSAKNRTFKIEYTSTVKTYFVEADMVVESESVKLNGRVLTRNNDYYIDYASGFITFYKGDEITESSVINITYDTAGGNSGNNSLMGGRLDYQIFNKIKVGTTVLKEGWDKPDTVPQVGDYSKDLLVYGADVSGKDIKMSDKVSVDFSAEVAQSEKNQNLYGYAMVDSMNETNVQTGGSMVFYDWRVGANPNGLSSFLDSVHWDTQEVPSLEINPNAVTSYNDKQQVLIINYDFTKPNTLLGPNGEDLSTRDEISLVYPLSDSGVDLSDKTAFELTMQGDGAGAPQVDFTFGNVSELSDASQGMLLPCSKYYPDFVPKTEDTLCRQSLAPNEDIGWEFLNPDGTIQRFNPWVNNVFNPQSQPNGRVDTQDLNGNGKLDYEDPTIGGHFGYNGLAITGLVGNAADYTGWKTFVTPLQIADKSKWTAVRHLRVTLKKGAKMKGQIKIANVALSGTAWNTQETVNPAQFSVSGINNVDSSTYVPIFSPNSGDGLMVFNQLYGSLANYRENSKSANVLDQALNVMYDTTSLPVGQELYANRNFKTMDFTQHREFRFLLHGAGAGSDGTEFFLKVGSDENYDKIIIPTGFNNWRLITLKMVDTTSDGIPDAFENASDPSYNVRVERVRTATGLMNFKKVSVIVSGVQRDATVGTGSAGAVWLNVIHLAEAIKLEGSAYKGDVVVRLDEWGSAGAKYKYMDSNFETPLTVSKSQEVTEEEYFVNVDKFKKFPMKATLNRSSIVTPNVADTTDYNTVSLLDKGQVDRQSAVLHGDFIQDNLPKIGLEYSMNQVDYDLLKRKDRAQTYAVTLQHEKPQSALRSVNAGYYLTGTTIDYDRSMHLQSDSNYNTDETTQRMNVKVNYQPGDKFNFVPSYNLTKSKEERVQYTASDTFNNKYPKAMNQNTGFTSTWKIASWLAPSVSYNVTTTENNNLTPKTITRSGQSVTVGLGEVKSINRNADGGITLTLNGNELMPTSKLFKNFVISSGYRIQDADAWENVDGDYDSRTDLWVRSSLKSVGDFGNRKSLTLRDTITSSQRWSPLAEYDLRGMLEAFKTVSLLNNFNRTMQTNDYTGTAYDSQSTTLPDMVFSISDIEKIFFASRWLSASNLKLRYSLVDKTNIGTDKTLQEQYGGDLRFMLFNRFDTVLTYTRQTSEKNDLRAGSLLESLLDDTFSAQTSFYTGSMRWTPKVTYKNHEKRLYQGQLNESTQEMIPSLNMRMDFNMPRGIHLPFLNRMYNATNRVIWNTTLSYTDKTSPVEVKDNYKSWDFNSSVDYEISQNLRLNVSGLLQFLNHAYVETEDYIAYAFSTSVTIQF